MPEKPPTKEFWKSVFLRLISNRLQNETFQVAQPGILNSLEKRGKFQVALDYAKKSESQAWEFFDDYFCALTPQQQTELSGATRQEWLAREQAHRKT